MATESAPAAPGKRSTRLLRGLLAAAAVALALAVWWSWLNVSAERQGLLDLLDRPDLQPLAATLEEQLRAEHEPPRMRLLLARNLLATEVDADLRQATLLRDPEEDLAARRRRLELARELAAEAFVERPTAWRAPAILGAATYLERSAARDRRLLTESAAWEVPLLHARQLAPGEIEPSRFLVLAYLETWRHLSPEKRELARELLQAAFEDRTAFLQLLDPWLTVAGSREEALAAIPDRAFAWEHLRQQAAARRDWDSYVEAQRRLEDSLEGELQRILQEAEARRGGGEMRRARDLYLGAAVGAPPSQRFLPVLRRALQKAPAGFPSISVSQGLRPWLEWSLDQCLYVSCPLPPEELDRLVGFVREEPAHQEAAGLAAAGDLPQAQLLERRLGRPWTEDWGPYHLLRARRLADQGRHQEARRAVESLHRRWRDSAPYARLAATLAESHGGPVEAPAPGALAAGEGAVPGQLWEWRSGGARLGVDRQRPGEGFELELVAVPQEGAVVELVVDGAASAPMPVHPGDVARWRQPIGAGPHLLELRTLAGARVAPGRLLWREPASSPPSPPPGPPPPPPHSPES